MKRIAVRIAIMGLLGVLVCQISLTAWDREQAGNPTRVPASCDWAEQPGLATVVPGAQEPTLAPPRELMASSLADGGSPRVATIESSGIARQIIYVTVEAEQTGTP